VPQTADGQLSHQHRRIRRHGWLRYHTLPRQPLQRCSGRWRTR
jgi:hypothetical protein